MHRVLEQKKTAVNTLKEMNDIAELQAGFWSSTTVIPRIRPPPANNVLQLSSNRNTRRSFSSWMSSIASWKITLESFFFISLMYVELGFFVISYYRENLSKFISISRPRCQLNPRSICSLIRAGTMNSRWSHQQRLLSPFMISQKCQHIIIHLQWEHMT